MAVFLAIWITVYGLMYQGELEFGIQLQGIFLGSLIILVMGLVDDLTELEPFVKFVVQVGAAVVLVLHDVALSLFIGTSFITQALTVIWVVGITNSFNFLDNMDGLASGVGAICAFIFAINSYRQGDPQTLYLSLILGGALVAFLRFNFDPAVIFLGDAGSGSIGFGFRNVGLSVDSGTSYFLPRIVGENVAKELVLTGEMVDAKRAEKIGLVNHVFTEDYDVQCRELVETIATGPSVALRHAARLVGESSHKTLEEAISDEAIAQGIAFTSPAHEAAVRAFKEG